MSVLGTLRKLRSRPPQKPARFVLMYAPAAAASVRVGELSFDGTAWSFKYAEEYKQRPDLRPLEGFDELDRVYRSSVLFPFFAVRIPDVEREDVRRKLEADRVRDPEPADLLRIFGRRVVSSPAFELLPA